MPFCDLATQYAALKPLIDARIQGVLDHGQYILGPEVAELEAALAQRLGVAHAVTVASGTEALLIALMALGVGPGDEVITPCFTFAATAEAVVLAGAKPVFVDVRADTANLDPNLLEAAVTPRTKAVVPVSLYGQMADLPAIRAVAERHGLAVVEDAAQSLGASLVDAAGRRWLSGAASTVGCTSFFPSKPLGCYGDGGALFTNDAALAEAARQIRVHGQSRRYHHVRVGVGGRMDTLQCAVLLAKLTRFDAELLARDAAAQRYGAALAGIEGLALPELQPGHHSAWAQYTVRVLGGSAARAQVQSVLRDAGVPTAIHYPAPLNHQPAYAAFCCPGCCAVSQTLAGQVLSLPMSADLASEDQDRVVRALLSARPALASIPQVRA